MLIKRTLPLLLIGLLVFIAYLYFFVDINEMIAVVKGINLFYFSLAVVVLLLDAVFYSLTWQYFLRPISVKVPFRKTLMFTWIGAFVDILVPAESISGDTTKAYLTSKESGKNAGKVVASVVSHRILSIAITLSSLIIGSLWLVTSQYKLPAPVLNLILLVVAGTSISLVFLFLLCFKGQLTQKIIDSLLRFLAFVLRGRLRLTSLRFKTRKALRAFHESIEILSKNPRSLVLPVVFSLVSWLLSVLLSFLVFVSLGHPIHFVVIMIVSPIAGCIQNIPIGVPGEVGLIEFTMTELYAALCFPLWGISLLEAKRISAAATILIRALTVWLTFFIGFMAAQWVGIKALVSDSR